jgi:MFS family permease
MMDAGGDNRVGRKGAALALLCVAQFVDVLDVNAVIVALHSIGEDLGFSRAGLQWVVSAYVLFFAGFCSCRGGWRTSGAGGGLSSRGSPCSRRLR